MRSTTGNYTRQCELSYWSLSRGVTSPEAHRSDAVGRHHRVPVHDRRAERRQWLLRHPRVHISKLAHRYFNHSCCSPSPPYRTVHGSG
jgi:hypothetical protein